jgi:acyl-coenzyme A synthetase/AMP-(fatty) acid ligase
VGYQTMAPARLLRAGFAAPEVAEGIWCVRWDAVTEAAALCAAMLPPFIDFHTSGTTGAARCWRRRRENLWLEAGLLADLIAPDRPEAIVSFAPTVHLFGALTSVLVPAQLGLPVWFRTAFAGAMPLVPGRRIAVIATPWIFQLLLQQMDWVRRFDHVTVLYGGAALPATAGAFLEEAGADRAAIVEVLGSTEAGGVATRRWRQGDPPSWTLFPDVEFATKPEPKGQEIPLSVRSPRLAFRPGERLPDHWPADDLIVPLDDRTFQLVGRSGRLAKVNGRRIDLDAAEHDLRAVLDCADLALVPVKDDLIGEHVDLEVVPKPGPAKALDLPAVISRLGVRPRRVTTVARIERSALGKTQARQELAATRKNVERAEVVTP